jgi:MoaA/NifB/PqqE/SkfB family radical SAM enzyme
MNDHKKLGNVLEGSLDAIWNGEKAVQFRQSILDRTYQTRCSGSCVGGEIPRDMRDVIEKDDLDTLMDTAKACIESHRYDRAAELLKNLAYLEPDFPNVYFELGKTYHLQKRYDRSQEILATACGREDASYYAYALRAKNHKIMGDAEAALRTLQEAAVRFPQQKDELSGEFAAIVPPYLEKVRKNNFDGTYRSALNGAREILGGIPQGEVFLRNKLLNEIEIAEHRPVLESKMRNLIVTLSTACNLKCVMCEWVRAKRWELPQKTLDEVVSCFPHLERVVWQGGEAFMYKGLRSLIEQAARFPNLRQVITTNGLLVNEEWAEVLVRNNVDVTFSVDGITPDVYEKIRQGADFDVLIRNLKSFSACRIEHQSRINTNLHMVVMRSNYRQVEDYVDFARGLGFRYIAFLPIEGNFDNPENIFCGHDPDAVEYLSAAMRRVEEKARACGMLIENRLPVKRGEDGSGRNDGGTGDRDNAAPDETARKMLCHLPWIQLYIDYDGSVRPDCTCPRGGSLGNVATDSLASLWNGDRMQEYRTRVGAGEHSGICNTECVQGRVSDRYLKFY